MDNLRVLVYLIFFRYPYSIIKAQTLWVFMSTIVYPLPRIFLGYDTASRIRDNFLKNKFIPVTLPVNRTSNLKIKMQGDYSDYLVFMEICVKDFYLQKEIKEGMTVIDIGAHVGIYTVIAAENVGPRGRVVSIEPESKNYNLLKENIKINNLKNVLSLQVALMDYEGSGKLYLNPTASVGHSFCKTHNLYPSVDVQVRTLDSLLEELNITKVDIIKIDTEGAELSILKGAENILKSNPKAKIFVASYHYPEEIKEVTNFLNEREFKTAVWKDANVITI